MGDMLTFIEKAEQQYPPGHAVGVEGLDHVQLFAGTHELDGLTAVSYTHLDVYKRQALSMGCARAMLSTPRVWRRSFCTPLAANSDRKSTRLNSSHSGESRMPSSA